MCQLPPSLSTRFFSVLLLPALIVAMPVHGQNLSSNQPFRSYSDIADMTISAPVILQATIRRTQRLKGEQAVGTPPGMARLLVNAAVNRLIVGQGGVPGEISYLVDVPLDSRGRPPKLKKSQFLLFLKPAAVRSDQFSLVSKHAQMPWSEAGAATTVSIVKEAQGNLGSLQITGIGNAFHVPGSIPGEAETQIFLTTADQRPVSLSVLRRPGEAMRWFVSLGEIVADSDAPAGKDTLLWYKLACFLPASLPGEVLDRLDGSQRDAVIADYRFVLASLGACGRSE